jgi:translation elongation factor EF-G
MGELHLEVVAERLRSEHKLELYTGAMRVAYREGLCERVTSEYRCASAPGGAEDITVVLGLRPERRVPWASEQEEAEADGGEDGGGAAGGRGRARAVGGGAAAEFTRVEGAAGGMSCGATQGVRDFLSQVCNHTLCHHTV